MQWSERVIFLTGGMGSFLLSIQTLAKLWSRGKGGFVWLQKICLSLNFFECNISVNFTPFFRDEKAIKTSKAFRLFIYINRFLIYILPMEISNCLGKLFLCACITQKPHKFLWNKQSRHQNVFRIKKYQKRYIILFEPRKASNI